MKPKGYLKVVHNHPCPFCKEKCEIIVHSSIALSRNNQYVETQTIAGINCKNHKMLANINKII